MNGKIITTQDERLLAGLAHGSILFGAFTSGIGGIAVSLVIWLTQKEKSTYVAAQSLQALVYQTAIFLLTSVAFCCWGLLWVAMLIPSLGYESSCCQTGLPPGFGAGLTLLLCPLGFWFLTILYGLWGAVRCLGGHDFRYAIVGSWLEQ